MDRFQIALDDFPGDEAAFLRTVRLVGKVSLADAVAIRIHARNAKGTVLVAGVDRRVADHIAAAFGAAGIAVTVQPSSVSSPMICRPQANVAYRWKAGRTIATE